MEGNIKINSDLNTEVLSELIFNNSRTTKQDLIIINGDLNLNSHKSYLMVLGNLYCDALMSCNTIMHFARDAHVKYVFNANVNNGITTIEGTVNVPYFLHSNHCANVNFNKETTLINYYGNDCGGWDFVFDYFESDLVKVFVEKVCPKGEFNRDDLLDVLNLARTHLKRNRTTLRLNIKQRKAVSYS